MTHSVWEEVFRTRAWGKYPGEDVVRFVARNFYAAPDRAEVRILEVGCGTGANLWFLAREGFCAHGIDASATGIAIAQARLDAECPGWRRGDARVAVGDMADLEYPDASFDAVLDIVAVCYCTRDAARGIYGELSRVTKPGGRMFCRAFETGCWGEGTGRAAGHQTWECAEGPLAGLGPTRFVSPAEVPELMVGWRIDQIDRSSVTMDGSDRAIRHLHISGTRPA